MTPEQIATLIIAASAGLVILGIVIFIMAVAFYVWDATREPEPRPYRPKRFEENT